MKFDVRPMITVGGSGGAQDVSAACNIRFNHNDNEINVRMLGYMMILILQWLVRSAPILLPCWYRMVSGTVPTRLRTLF